MRNKEDAVKLACQIAYEYKDWGWEHISDMLATYERPERPPCNGDELYNLCNGATKHLKNGLSFEDAVKEMMGEKKVAA